MKDSDEPIRPDWLWESIYGEPLPCGWRGKSLDDVRAYIEHLEQKLGGGRGLNILIEIAIIAVIEGVLIVWTMERVPRVEAWFAGRGRRRELNGALKRLKVELKATATIKHLVECIGNGPSWASHNDNVGFVFYLESIEHDLQRQINDVRGKR